MSSLKKINYLNDVFYPLSVVLMESFWVFPWLIWMGLWPSFSEEGPALSLLSVIIMLVASLVITRIATKRDWPVWLIRSVVIGSGLVAMFLVLRIDHNGGFGIFDTGWYGYAGEKLAHFFSSPHPLGLAIAVMIYLWWRGIALGRSTAQFRSIYTSFLTGMTLLIFLIVLWRITSGDSTYERPGGDIGLYVIAFFFFGLISIAVGHLYMMHRAMPKEEAALTSIWRWLPMMLGVIGGMIIVGFVVASVFSRDFFQVLKTGFGYISDGIVQIIEWLSVPLNWVIEIVIKFLQWIFNIFRTETQPTAANQTGGSPFDDVTVTDRALSPEVIMIIKWVIIALVIALIIFILAKAISRYLDRHGGDKIEEIHESLWNIKDIRNDFRLFLKMLGDKFKRKSRPGPGYLFETGSGGKMNVREIYRHLLWEGKRSGLPRRRHETVTEYARRLEKSIPEGTGPVDNITDLYSDVRYGDISIQEEKVDSANTLWGTIRNLLRSLRGA